MAIKVVHIETGQEATALGWNLQAMSEIIVGHKDWGTDSDFSRNWVCACHHLPLAEGDYGQVLCQKGEHHE